jgi:hypothetical protein
MSIKYNYFDISSTGYTNLTHGKSSGGISGRGAGENPGLFIAIGNRNLGPGLSITNSYSIRSTQNCHINLRGNQTGTFVADSDSNKACLTDHHYILQRVVVPSSA